MKNINLLVLLALMGISFSCSTQPIEKRKIKLSNEVDSVSYNLGIVYGESLKNSPLEELNYEALAKGLADAMTEESEVTFQQADQYLSMYVRKLQEVQAEKNLEEGRAFLAENAKRDEVKTLPSGLQYEVLEEGTGKTPVVGDKVEAHYIGMHIDGEVFQSSREMNRPFEFTVGEGVIEAWSEIVQLMKEGARYKIYAPTELAYGTNIRQGMPFEANEALIFEIELLEVTKGEASE